MGDLPHTIQAGLSAGNQKLNLQRQQTRFVQGLSGRTKKSDSCPQSRGSETAERSVLMSDPLRRRSRTSPGGVGAQDETALTVHGKRLQYLTSECMLSVRSVRFYPENLNPIRT